MVTLNGKLQEKESENLRNKKNEVKKHIKNKRIWYTYD